MNDRIKSEFITLNRHKKTIYIGICRCSDHSLLNNTTIQHLSSLTFDEFQKISLKNLSTSSPNRNRKSLTAINEIVSNTDLKIISHKHRSLYEQQYKSIVQKRSITPNRDSGFIETDGTNTSMLTDRSMISSHNNKRRSKISLERSEDESMDTHKSLDSLQQSFSKVIVEPTKNKSSDLIYSTQTRDKYIRRQDDVSTQTVTDACCIYRRQLIKPDVNDDDKTTVVLHGREISHEAANAPTIPSSMPNYTRDQIRELYGELDRKTRCLHEDEYTPYTTIIKPSNDKPQWKLASPTKTKITDECPLPKFRLDTTVENNETLFMAAYLSTGLTNPRTKPIVPIDKFHTVMMNASAKVNEWANNNEIYLVPINGDIVRDHFHASINKHRKINSSPLLFEIDSNLKQIAVTPTNDNDRPTFLKHVEQQSTVQSNQSTNNQGNRRSIRRQDHTMDATLSSSNSVNISVETTPSTPDSCGMYLEPYMCHGYGLPSMDYDIRDSSWQHIDNDDIEESTISMKDMIANESSTISKIDTKTLPSSSMSSQLIDSDSLIDLDDDTTISYHTAKESRIDNTCQSSLSIESDETTATNRLYQPIVRDELTNHIISPRKGFSHDTPTSPSNANEQITSSSSSSDNQHVLIDNLTNLLEQIETFNGTNRPLLTTINEEKLRLSPEGEESTKNNIDQLITIVEDIHQFNQVKTIKTVDNLLFIYDDINDGLLNPSVDDLVDIDHSIQQPSSCMNNLLFVYDDVLLPSDGEPKPMTNESDEWSYDNLATDQDEQINIEYLGTIVQEILADRFQEPIEHKQSIEDEHPSTDTQNLDTLMCEVLTARLYKPNKETDHEIIDPITNVDNLETNVQEPIATSTLDQVIAEVSVEKYQTFIDEPVVDNDNLESIALEILATKSTKIKSTIEFDQTDSMKKSPELTNESTFKTEVYETLQTPVDKFDQSSALFNLEESVNKATDNIHSVETITYEIESSIKQPDLILPESDLSSVNNSSQIVPDSLSSSSNYHHFHQNENEVKSSNKHEPFYEEEIYEEYGYCRTTTDSNTNDIIEKYEELCQSHWTNSDQYQMTSKNLDDEINQFDQHLNKQKQHYMTTPTSDTISEELITTIERVIDRHDEAKTKKSDTGDYCSTIAVKRQPNYSGKYGFDFEEWIDGKIRISTIIDENFCPNLNIGDEIISINNNQTCKTYEQCQLLFDLLWKNFHENIQITVIKSVNITNLTSK